MKFLGSILLCLEDSSNINYSFLTQAAQEFFAYFICMSIMHVCLYHLHTWYLQRSEEGNRLPRSGVKDGCELQCGCWMELLSFQSITSEPKSCFKFL